MATKKTKNTPSDKHIWAILLVVSIGVGGFLMNQIDKPFHFTFDTYINVSKASSTTALRLSPTTTTVGPNQTFNVDILLDTGGENIDGIDIFYLRFNPSLLQVVDANTGVTGVQISPTTLLPATSANLVDNTAGTLQFSQTTSGGSTFTGSGKIATINFKSLTTAGTASVTFDFTLNSTTDTNVSAIGSDKLTIVQNASLVVDTSAPTVSITSPTSGSTVSGTVSIAATASDSNGIAGVQFKLDGANLGVEDTSSPYSYSWDSTGALVGSHTISAVARDTAGNTSTATSSVTVSNQVSKSTTINLSFEGRTTKTGSGKLQVLNSSKALLNEYSFTTNTAGAATLSFTQTPQQVYLKVIVTGYLTRILGPYDYNTLASSFTFPLLLSGEFNGDNIINSLDFSYLNSKWFGTDSLADINKDGIINTIDFSWLNKNWFVSGEN